MSEIIDGIRVRPLARSLDDNIAVIDGIRARPLSLQAKNLATTHPESSIASNLTKAGATGLLSNLDLPQNIGSLIETYGGPEYGIYGQGRKLYHNLTGQKHEPLPSTNYVGSLPSISSKVKGGLKDYLGIDLTPKAATAKQRVANKAAEFAGSLAGFGGALNKGLGLLNSGKQTAKLGALGAFTGATSGALQEAGVDPLAADLSASLATPLGISGVARAANGSGNLLGRFFSPNRTKIKQDKLNNQVSDLLRQTIGEQNLPAVLKNLDAPSPLGINPTTAELAQNTGLSQLHRASQGTIPQLAEKEALNDAIIRNQLEKLGKTGIAPEVTGTKVRSKLVKNLEQAKLERAQVTKPLYDKLYALEEQVPLSNLTEFLEQQKTFAKGTKKRTIENIESLIKGEVEMQNLLKNFERDYASLNPAVKKQLKEELGFANKLKPGEIEEVVKELNLMLSKAKKLEQNSITDLLMKAKNAILEDISVVPEEQLARGTYNQLSAPVNAIEAQPFLKRLVKRDDFEQEFLLDPAKIPGMINRQSPRDVKALLNQVGDNPTIMQNIRGSVVDELLGQTELSALGATGEAKLSYNGLNKYLKRNKANLALIFEPAQLKVLEDAKEILRRRNMVATTGRAAGSDTAANLTILEAITDNTKQKILTKTANKSVAGRIALSVYDAFKEVQQQELKRLLEKALIDPKTAKALLTNFQEIKQPKTLNNILQQIYPPTLAAPVLNDLGSVVEGGDYGLQ